MQMMKCPKCGAENSIKREGCFNCGSLLLPPATVDSPEVDLSAGGRARPVYVAVPHGEGFVMVEARIPQSSVWIGILAGIVCVPFALAFLASDLPARRAYGRGLLIGFGIAAATALAIISVLGR